MWCASQYVVRRWGFSNSVCNLASGGWKGGLERGLRKGGWKGRWERVGGRVGGRVGEVLGRVGEGLGRAWLSILQKPCLKKPINVP